MFKVVHDFENAWARFAYPTPVSLIRVIGFVDDWVRLQSVKPMDDIFKEMDDNGGLVAALVIGEIKKGFGSRKKQVVSLWDMLDRSFRSNDNNNGPPPLDGTVLRGMIAQGIYYRSNKQVYPLIHPSTSNLSIGKIDQLFNYISIDLSIS